MKSYRIELRLLWTESEIVSRFKVTQSLVGVVFLGGWLTAMAMLSVFGSPVLRSGPSPFFLLTGIAVCFAIIPTGLLFSVAGLSPLLYPDEESRGLGVGRTSDVYSVNLNRLLWVVMFLLFMAALADINRFSGRDPVRQDSVAVDVQHNTEALRLGKPWLSG